MDALLSFILGQGLPTILILVGIYLLTSALSHRFLFEPGSHSIDRPRIIAVIGTLLIVLNVMFLWS
jgi:hypothetical protein